MNQALAIAGLPLPPDPPQDQCGRKLSPATAELLILSQVLLVYARHLRDTLQQRAQRGFSRIARCFGSAQAGFVLANLTRGILRAIMLERVLLAQAGGKTAGGKTAGGKTAGGKTAGGKSDPAAGKPRGRTPPAAQQAAGQQASDQLPGLPTLRQLQAAIRHRPVESVIDDITHDLGVACSLCEVRFGNTLRDAIAAYRGTVSTLFKEFVRPEAVIADPPERNFAFDRPAQKRDAIRTIVGLLGAEPGCAFSFTAPPVAAAKAGAHPP